jgi:DNA-binding PadR family transcriptional regulator
MLTWAHSVTLESVAQGDPDPEAPALKDLVATGLVRHREDGDYEVTDQGRAALEIGKPSRFDRISNRILAVCAVILLAAFIERIVS